MKTISLVTTGTLSFELDGLSADGRYVLYDAGIQIEFQFGQLYLKDSQTGQLQQAATDGDNYIVETGFAVISQDGEFIAYASTTTAPTFVETINLFDRVTGESRVVFSDATSSSNSGITTTEAISADDQSVFFISSEPDLTGDSGYYDLFQLNVQTGAVQRLLVDTRTGTGGSQLAVAAGGRYIAASADDGSGGEVLYRIDLATGDIDVIADTSFEIGSTPSALSADGRFAVFTTSDALLPGDTDGVADVYLKDLSTGDLRIVSTTASGVAEGGFDASISSDGSKVIFETSASFLTPGAAGYIIVSKDLATGAVTLLMDANELSDNDVSFSVSADGNTLAVETAYPLIAGDTDNKTDVYLLHFTQPILTVNAISGDDYVNAADGSSITVSGTSDAIGSTVLVSLPGSQTTTGALVHTDGTWSTIISIQGLGDGPTNLHAVVTDGYTTNVDHPFTVDRTPPTDLAITSVAGDNIINAAEVKDAIISGTVLVADPSGTGTDVGTLTISIDGGTSTTTFTTSASTSNADATFAEAFDASGVSDGEHIITVTAADPAGNTTTVTKQVLVDTTPPKIAITSVSGDDVVNPSEVKSAQGVHGTSDAIGQTVDVLVDGVEAGQAVVQPDGIWLTTVSFAAAATGGHDVTAKVSDEAGNPSRADAGVYVDRGFSATQLSVGPSGQQGGGGGVMFPVLDGAGDKLVFTGLNFNLMSTATGSSGAQVYIKDLTTGAISFATPDPSENAEFASISPDGRYIEFVSNANLDPDDQSGTGNPPGYYLTYTEDLTTNSIYFHNLTDDRYDGTDPDTLDPGITSGYYDGDPDNSPIQPLPVFPLATADGGNSLELIDDLEPDQVVLPLVMTTQIRLDVNSLGTDGTPFFYSGGYAIPDAIPPADNDFGRFVLQEFAPQISADGSVMAFEARFFGEQWDTSGYPPAVTIEPPTLPEIYAGPTPREDDGGGGAASELASSYADGTPMPFGAIDPALSADGKFVAFWSWDNDDQPEVYVKNLTTGELDIASSDALGNSGVGNAAGTFNAGFNSIAISADGRYVAFTSDGVLTPDDSGTGADLFIKDMQTGAITRLNLPAGTFANDLSTQLTMTADRGYIAFTTSAGLNPLDNNTVTDIYGVSVAAAESTPPQIAISPVTGNDQIDAAEDSTHVTVSGTSDAIGQTVTLYVDGGFLPGVTVGSGGTWSTTIDTTHLTDGVHQLRATVATSGGATDTAGDLITIDRVAPTVTLSADNTDLAPGQTATITASFSEGIGNLTPNFLSATGGTLSGLTFIDDHTVTELFTPTSGATAYGVDANPGGFFDYAGNANTTGATLDLSAGEAEGDGLTGQGLTMTPDAGQASVAAAFSDADTAAGAGDLSATIDWGDGTTTAGTVSGGNGAFTVNGLHSYAAPAPVSVTVTLADNPPGTATASVTLSVPATPVVTAVSSAVNASASETFTPAQLFSASEAEGFPILSYEVEDESPGPSQGFWVLNGAVLAAGQLTTLSTAQLSQLSFVAGASSSTSVADTLEVEASDAGGFGAFATFTVTAAKFAPGDGAPTVTAASVQKAPGLSLAPSSLFSASVPQGETVTSYEVEDTTPNSGHWVFNGVVEPTNQLIDVTVAQLSQLSFVTGSGTDTLMVRANDGTQWGNFTTFTVAPPPNAAPPAATSADMVMRRGSDGTYECYDIGHNTILLDGPLGQIDPALQVAGIGGFNGADTADLLMRDPTTGVLTLYDVSNNNITGNVALGTVGPEWTVSGFGDFSGHAGETDLLMRNSSTSAFEVYDIVNDSITFATGMGQVGLEWSVAGFGDFATRANETDMLMRNSNTGAFEVYDIVNNTITSYAPMGQVGPEWTIAGFGDFAGHANETDMLMRNSNTGAFEVYDIVNNTITSYAPMGQVGLEWTIAGFGDFSGDANETDMLMRNSITGAFELYDINHNAITLATGMGQVGLEWSISGVAASPASAPPATQLSGPAVDPAGIAPSAGSAQFIHAMASFASMAATSAANSPMAQAPGLEASNTSSFLTPTNHLQPIS